MFRACVYIIICSILMINALKYNLNQNEDLLNDLPQKSDLIVYLQSLRRIIEFCSKNKNDLDINFELGLFLMSVNFKAILLNKNKSLPKPLFIYISKLTQENDELIDFFKYMVNQSNDPRYKSIKLAVSLFFNETNWINELGEFDASLIHVSDVRSASSLDKQAISMSKYMSRVDDLDKWVPSPKLSDMCMISLGSSPDFQGKCAVHESCYDMLLNGTDFGYALSHRLLFLLHSRHGRNCEIFSEKIDKKLIRKYCTNAYDEAKFISNHEYGIMDLLLEFIALCAFEGHAQFLRRDWLSKSLQHQTEFGCFGQYLTKSSSTRPTNLLRPSKTWKMVKYLDHRIFGGLCDGHVTAVAAGSLSVAVRYIVEHYY